MEINKYLAAIVSFSLLSGCGGSSSSSDSQPTPTPPSNVAPEAQSDSVVISTNQKTAVDVLANDSDSDGDSLTITQIISGPANGNATIEDNQLFFTPELNSVSVQTLTYEISDGQQTSQADVEITLEQQLTIAGKVPSQLMTASAVKVRVRNEEIEAEVDNEGNFSTSVTLTNEDEIIWLEANGTSLAGSESFGLNTIISANDFLSASFNLDDTSYPVYINELTTADYLLASPSIGFENTSSELTDARASYAISDKLELAALVNLIAEESAYTLADGQTLSSLFALEQGKLDSSINAYLESIGLLSNNLDRAPAYSTETALALASILSNADIVKPFDTAAISGKSFNITAESQSGLLAYSGRTAQFNQDGTGVSFPNVNENSPTLKYDFTWEIVDGKLIKSFTADTYSTFKEYLFPPLDGLIEKYGFSRTSVNQLEELLETNSPLPATYIYITQGVQSEIYTLLADTDGRLVLHKETVTEISASKGDSLIPFELPELNSVKQTVSINDIEHFASNSKSLFEGYTEEEIQGDWLLYVESEFDNRYTLEPLLTADKISIQEDKAEALLANKTYSVAFAEGIITLTEGNTSYTYKPYKQEGSAFLARLEKLVDGEIQYSVVKQIAKANTTTALFSENIATELPNVKLSYLNGLSPANYRDGQLNLYSIFGFQFNQDGSLRYGILGNHSYVRVDGTWVKSGNFSIPTASWLWVADDEKIEMTYNNNLFSRKRVWFPISSDDNGVDIILEYNYSTVDNNFNGSFDDDQGYYVAYPRMMILKGEDLSQWQEAWENTSF